SLQTPYSVWITPGQALDWAGHWVVPINNPTASAGQAPPSYIYAQTFRFSDMRATATISLGTGTGGKFASFIVVKPDGRVDQVAIAYNWTAEKAYFLYAQHLGGGRWGAWVVDGTTGGSTAIGSLNVSAQHQKASAVSVTSVLWYAGATSDCSTYPEAKVVFLPPVGFSGGQIVTAAHAQNITTAGECPAINQPIQNMVYYGVGAPPSGT
ncbi:MAG TPA: hypothetical protein VHJ40_07835, partial [Actinomycetota bacterium]|nr:hypothetical protein [Actinomycetota bacterium]